MKRPGRTLALATCITTMLFSCGDDYTKNQTEGDQSTPHNADASKQDPSTEMPSPNASQTPSEEEQELGEQGSNNQNQQGTPNNNSSGVTLQDLLSGLFGGGSGNSSGNSGNTGGNTTPIPPAPEPSSDDCIGADEFICAIEVAITYHTNLLRPATSPLIHHARLSYVSRDWSQKQMQRGSISHQGFPASRNQVYKASFPGDSISIQAENVAYSSGRSGEAEAIAKMFVNMWANSAGHRRNMLGNYRILGVGVTKNGNRYYATQIFGKE